MLGESQKHGEVRAPSYLNIYSVLQTDSNYLKLKDDMIYAEGAVQEVEAKLANLNEELIRIVD